MDRMGERRHAVTGGSRTLAARLEDRDRERFVGRAAELAVLEGCLEEDSAVSVVLVYGPGGIGKSTLLREFGRRARARGWETFVVEGRELTPTPDALEALVAAARQSPRPLVLIDSYERMTALGGYLRRGLLPSLPDSAVVLIAGRTPPDDAWFQGGWEMVATELGLEKLAASEALALLQAQGVVDTRSAAIVRWADGSPLALALAADAAESDADWDPAEDEENPGILRSLIRRLAEAEMRSVRFSALAVATIARVTTADMLGAVLADGDAEGAYERLRELSFSEPLGDGLTLHDLVRKALRADLRRRDPDRDRELRRRIVDHLFDRSERGDPLLAIEMAHLIENPVIKSGFGWEGSMDFRIDDARSGDAEQIAGLMEAWGFADWWSLTKQFFAQAPDRVGVARDRQEAVCGFLVSMSPDTAPDFAHDDPLVGPWLAHARECADLGGSVLWHDSFDFTGGRAGKLKPMLGVAGVLRSGVSNPRFAYLPIDPRKEASLAFVAMVGAAHLSELDCDIGSRRIQCHRIDYGPGGLIAAERAVVYAELGLASPAVDDQPQLDREAVREALRKFHLPHELARSSLGRGATPEERIQSVRALLQDAATQAFGDSQNEQLLQRVLVKGYLEPGPTHEQAAYDLSLSRAAYFRRLRVAADRLADHVANSGSGG
jgi:hypothetical protein